MISDNNFLPSPSYQRWCIRIEYEGTPFVGWQCQTNGNSVQELLENAATKISAGRLVNVYGAGRTDSGVHALGQMAHLELSQNLTKSNIQNGINACLKPWPIAITWLSKVQNKFHARFSAQKRHYLYRILNRQAPAPLLTNRVWHYRSSILDITAMKNAALLLEGHHDFTSMRASQCQSAQAVKTLDQLTVTKVDDEIHIHASARSFLHHQVRNMVGTLVDVGIHRYTPDRISFILAEKNRSLAGPTAPAHGLYLMQVDYPQSMFIHDI